MITMLLPGSGKLATDAADALAVAITHAHHRLLPQAVANQLR
jgi:Holliday junction resolvasome RuvABC endonuclease subunit